MSLNPVPATVAPSTAAPADLLEWALFYAGRGWAVFPLDGKIPFQGSAGFKDASKDEATIRSFWQKHPSANVGVATGAVSGLVVLDVDPANGGEVIGLDLPHTVGSLTGGGGAHYYFKHPGGIIRNSAGKIGPGLDLRGDGGYVVAPPSMHSSGRRYEWEASSRANDDDVPLAPLPDFLLEPAAASIVSTAAGSEEPIPEGRRNDALASLAGSMRRRGMSESAILAALQVVNAERCKPPLSEPELRTIARSFASMPANDPLPTGETGLQDEPVDPEAVPDGYRSPAEVLDAIPQPKFRFPSGIPSLDAASRGGLPTGCVVIFVGWPDAGKTGLGTQIILDIATKNEVVAVLFTPDGGQQATAIRIGGLLGLDQDKLEERDPEEKEKLRELLREHRIFIVDDAQDGMVYERVRADMEKVRPDLPHIYLLDSAQECLATDAADELDERHRVIALARAAYKTVEANPIPSLALVTSQVAGQSFAPRKRDRTAPIGSPAESKKLSFLSHMIVYLEGDPAKEPDFGQAAVVKSKLRGPKPSFGLRVDPVTSRLKEIDAIVIEQERSERIARVETARISNLGDQIATLLGQYGPLNVASLNERLPVKKNDLLRALAGLEARRVAAWDPGPKNSHVWRLADAL